MRCGVLVALIIVEVVYVTGGGLVFWALQSSNESTSSPPAINTSLLVELIEEYFGNESCINESQLKTLVLLASTGNGSTNASESSNWDIGGSIFFAMTVVSTIGYGNLYPTNGGSRAFCCCYALIGIPITLVMMVGIGEKLNRLAGRLETRLIKKRPRIGKIARSAVLLCAGLVFFLLIPAIVFSYIQDWSFGSSVYYGVITLTTIGFGDMVAGFPLPDWWTSGTLSGLYRVSIGIWIYIGLAWVSGLISSLQESFNATVHRVDSDPILDRYRNKHQEQINKHEVSLTDSRTDGHFMQLDANTDDEYQDHDHVTSGVSCVSPGDVIVHASVANGNNVSPKGTPV